MQFLILSGNPKRDGLCHSVMEAVAEGAQAGGAQVEIFAPVRIERCRMCGDGWGPCKEKHVCAFGDGDGFHEGQAMVAHADAICLISPVYWHEISEGLKCFLDKLRRCESGPAGALAGKPVLLIASPGGTGNGMLSALEQMDRFCRHTHAKIFDYIGINRWNQDYKRQAAYRAAMAIAEGRCPGETYIGQEGDLPHRP